MEVKKEKDYTKYTYKNDAKVEVSGATFNFINVVLNTINEDEVKVFYAHENSSNSFSDTPTMFSTPKGMAIGKALEMIFNEHVKNVESGVAVSIEEEERPKIKLSQP